MTCIVGYEDKGDVYIGADSLSANGWEISRTAENKVFIKDEMMFGFTGSFRLNQILEHCFKKPEHPHGMDDHKYLCSIWIDALMECLIKKKFAEIEDNEVNISRGSFLLGYRRKLYFLAGDFQVHRTSEKFNACGCGKEYALGALTALKKIDMPAKKKIKLALKVSEERSGGVRGPFKILKLKSRN